MIKGQYRVGMKRLSFHVNARKLFSKLRHVCRWYVLANLPNPIMDNTASRLFLMLLQLLSSITQNLYLVSHVKAFEDSPFSLFQCSERSRGTLTFFLVITMVLPMTSLSIAILNVMRHYLVMLRH